MATDNGGPAFPSAQEESVFVEELGRYDERLTHPVGGMSLRDYFAAQLAAAACSRASVPDFLHEDGIAAMAKEAYKRADAMIAERLK